jgi:hypothetical protein
MANEFSTELARIQLRSQALTANLPTNDEGKNKALITLNRVLALEDRYKGAEGWYAEHVPLFIQMQNCAESLVNGKTLTEARGHGVVATITDRLRTNGNGLGRCFKSIENFLDVPIHADREVINGIVFPVADTMEQSKVMLAKMRHRLKKRERKIMLHESGIEKLDKDTRDFYLIKGEWTPEKISAYCIEYIARLFAMGIDEEQREALVEDPNAPITGALDSLRSRFILAPA